MKEGHFYALAMGLWSSEAFEKDPEDRYLEGDYSLIALGHICRDEEGIRVFTVIDPASLICSTCLMHPTEGAKFMLKAISLENKDKKRMPAYQFPIPLRNLQKKYLFHEIIEL